MKTFADLGVKEAFMKALTERKIIQPSEIQERVIPFLLTQGTDIIAQAQTGTGKTAAFGLPLLQRINVKSEKIQALILVPTRELGQQVAKELFRFTKYSDKIFTEAVYGGANIDDQIRALKRPTHIVVATPGRLIDLLEKKALDLAYIQTVVLDEADEMLSMGFKKDIDTILSYTKIKNNIWLFSATLSSGVQSIISAYMSPDAFKVEVEKKDEMNKNIEHQFLFCDEEHKFDILLQFLATQKNAKGMLFCKTKAATQELAKQLMSKKIAADALHGDLFQSERDKVVRAFKNDKINLLVATDIAARGLDIQDLAFVVHYQMPDQTEYYTHRSGRTARAGKKGVSISFVSERDKKLFQNIERTFGIKMKRIFDK
jgi:ATP-dependent RNA helicase DeaD